ncbi:hypothetical protein AB5J72_36470 [Streptomyces sp. CG1]|uniref:hypothetical protein n=1 Tax=Streptomyces sp. CG1 TaxID=1287523 RepID=UPI0034E2997C
MAARHRARIDTLNGPRVCYKARIERKNRQPLVARFGGIPLQQQRCRGGWPETLRAGRRSGRTGCPGAGVNSPPF